MNAPALTILASLPRTENYVIAGEGANVPRNDITNASYRIRSASGLDGGGGQQAFRLHDYRHSFASVAVGSGLDLPIVGKLLGHSQPATTARYAHLDADPVRRAVSSTGATIAPGLGNKNIDVVPRR
jgi:integrase